MIEKNTFISSIDYAQKLHLDFDNVSAKFNHFEIHGCYGKIENFLLKYGSTHANLHFKRSGLRYILKRGGERYLSQKRRSLGGVSLKRRNTIRGEGVSKKHKIHTTSYMDGPY